VPAHGHGPGALAKQRDARGVAAKARHVGVREAQGQRGPNRDYAINTWQALCDRGVRDPKLERLARLAGETEPLPSDSAPIAHTG
jgi:cation transport regulator ChaC